MINNPHAFPSHYEVLTGSRLEETERALLRSEKGMSLRDYMAGQALAGLSVGCAGMLGNEFSAYAKGHCNSILAERAYALADAMLEARNRESEGI